MSRTPEVLSDFPTPDGVNDVDPSLDISYSEETELMSSLKCFLSDIPHVCKSYCPSFTPSFMKRPKSQVSSDSSPIIASQKLKILIWVFIGIKMTNYEATRV